MDDKLATKIAIAAASVGTFFLIEKLLFSFHRPDKLDIALSAIQNQFHVPTTLLSTILENAKNDLSHGLLQESSTFRMLPSYVTSLPTGKEVSGDPILALDLGGTNFRVCAVTLLGNGKFNLVSSKFTMGDSVKSGDGSGLFRFIAGCINEFLTEYNMLGKNNLKMGFTFSWQHALNRGTLVQWNKGVNCSGVVGHDVVELLQNALKEKGLDIKVNAVVNDTVGTLVAHAYQDPKSKIGVILGTGTNAAYIEPCKSITKANFTSTEMVINIEWGAFFNGLPVTGYDKQLDKSTFNPGKQIFEKLISGMYLGEIVRLILCDWMDQGIIFKRVTLTSLRKPYSFETSYMSRIEKDSSYTLSEVRGILRDNFGMTKATQRECEAIQRVCQLVGLRSARLSATLVAAVLHRCGNALFEGCTVAIDGSLFERYPNYAVKMHATLRELLGCLSDNITLSLASDGSGVGAALIAFLAE